MEGTNFKVGDIIDGYEIVELVKGGGVVYKSPPPSKLRKETFMKAAEVEGNELYPISITISHLMRALQQGSQEGFIQGAQWAFDQLKKD